jgi:transcriptional regulator with XRE-family HTH domain
MIREKHKKRYDEIRLFIKNYRLNDEITQCQFGKMAETHTNTIRNLEAGKNITVRTLFNCIDALDMTISEFFQDME